MSDHQGANPTIIHDPDQYLGVPKSGRISTRRVGLRRMQMLTENDRAAHLNELKAKMKEMEVLFEETEWTCHGIVPLL
jgi:hypothetical protein